MHGVMMVFFFLIPSIPATLGNFLVPMMIGAQGPRLPAHQPAELVHLHGRRPVRALPRWSTGGVDTGWTFYTPYSTARLEHARRARPALGIFIAGFSSILTGLNFIVTIHTMRAPGMTWCRLPLFIWAHYATSLIMILARRSSRSRCCWSCSSACCSVGIFDPALGGDPVLFQHLFWFYSHPAVYIMVLPGMGVDQRARSPASPQARLRLQVRRRLEPRHRGARLPGLGTPHVRRAASRSTPALVFSFLSFLVAIPSAIKVFNWTATLYKGSISLDTPMLYALGFIGLFTIGGLTGLFLAALGRRRARPRHLLRRRPLPLRHGRRHGDGLPRRPALLVAEDHRQHVYGAGRASCRRSSSSSAST